MKKSALTSKGKLTAVIYAALLFVCAFILGLSAYLTVRAGTVADAAALQSEWDAYIVHRGAAFDVAEKPAVTMAEVYNTAFTSGGAVADFQADVFKNAMLVDPNGSFEYVNHKYIITLSSAEELVKFSLGSYGTNTDGRYYAADYALFIRSAHYRLGRNIDFADGSVFYTDDSTAVPVRPLESYDFDEAVDFVSNGGYYGYNQGFASTVPGKFVPVTGFKGEFDGCGFNITGLKIRTSAERGSGNYITASNYDAMFSEIQAGGTVKRFGLIESETIIPEGTADSDKRPLAIIAGRNEGTVTQVFSLGAVVRDGGTSVAADVVHTDSGSLTEYYSAELNGAAGYARSSFTEANWYPASALTSRYIDSRYGSYPTLSGLVSTATNAYAIYSPADLLALTQAVTENRFPDISITVTVAADLDMRYNPTVIPAQNLTGNKGAVTLKGAAGGAAKALTTVANLTLDAYIHSRAANTRNVGLFNWLSGGAITVTDLVFYNCSAQMPSQFRTDAPELNVGLLVGQLNGGYSLSNVFANPFVGMADGTVSGSPNIGGLIGRTNAGTATVTRVYLDADVTGGVYAPAVAGKTHNSGGLIGSAGNNNASSSLDTVFIGGRVVAAVVTDRSSAITAGGIMGAGYQMACSGVLVVADIFSGRLGAAPGGGATNLSMGGLSGLARNALSITSADMVKMEGDIRLNYAGMTGNLNAGGLTGAYGVNVKGTASAIIKTSDLFSGAFYYPSDTVAEGSTDGRPDNAALSVRIGNLTGFAGSASAYAYFEQDKRLTVHVGRVNGIYVGGVIGYGEGLLTMNHGEASGAVALNSYENNAGKDLCVSGLGYNVNAQDTVLSGSVSLQAFERGKVLVSGLGYKGTFTRCTLSGTAEASTLLDNNASVGGLTNIGKVVDSAAAATARVSFSAGAMVNTTANIGGLNVTGAVSGSVFAGEIAVSLSSGKGTFNVGGIAASSNSVEGSVYAGKLTAAMQGTNAYYFGGIAGVSSGTLSGCVNKGVFDMTGSTSGGNYVGGILGGAVSGTVNINNCVNEGTLSVTGGSGADLWLGGLVGRGNATLNITGGINAGSVSLTSAGGHTTAAGGLLGIMTGGTVRIADSLGYGSVSAANTAGKWASAGGIVGVIANPHGGSFAVYDSVNKGAVSAFNAGGFVGYEYHVSGVPTPASFKSNVNYGNVTGEQAGGIAGLTGNDFQIVGAVNYGTVTGTSAAACIGGITGRGAAANGSNEQKTIYTDVLNYGALTGTAAYKGGIIGASINKNDSPGSLGGLNANAAFVSFTRAVVLNDAADTANGERLIGNNTNYDSDPLNAVTTTAAYTDTAFFLHPERETETYASAAPTSDGATEEAALVWSEYPYAPAHSALTGQYCFAVTTATVTAADGTIVKQGGRIAGAYTGSTIPAPASVTVNGTVWYDNAAAVAAISASKQITMSRDAFIKTKSDFYLTDSSKTTDATQTLPELNFTANKYVRETNEGGVVTKVQTFYSIVENTSAYFINNRAGGEFVIPGASVTLKGDVNDLVSEGANTEWRFIEVQTITIPYNENNIVRVGRYALDVWQGASKPAEGSRYRNTYYFEVWYYNSEPTLDNNGAEPFRLAGPNGTTVIDSTVDDPVGGESTEDEVAYDFETTDGAPVTVDWQKGILTAEFSSVNITEAASADIALSLWKKSDDGTYAEYAPSPARYLLASEYTAVGSGGSVTIGNLTFEQVAAVIKVTATLTDYDSYLAIPAGDYRLTVKVPKAYGSTITYFTRHFRFSVEASADVTLHYADGTPASGAQSFSYSWMQRNSDTGYRYGSTGNHRTNLAGAGSIDAADAAVTHFSFTLSKPYYGAFFDLTKPASGGALGMFGNLLLPSEASVGDKDGNVGEPAFTLTAKEQGAYTAVYAFSVLAADGIHKGLYTFTIDWSFAYPANPNPPVTSDLTAEVGKKDTKTVSGAYNVGSNNTFLSLTAVKTYYQNIDGGFDLITPPDTLTVSIAENGGVKNGFTAAFVPATPNGVYRFDPCFTYRYAFDFTGISGVSVTAPATLTEFDSGGEYSSVTVTKTASKLSYLRDITYAVSANDNKSTAVSYVAAADPIEMADASRLIAASEYPTLSGIGDTGARIQYSYTNGSEIDRYPAKESSRIKQFMVYPLFESAANDLDYNTYVYMIVNGEVRNEGLTNAEIYNDEYVSIYPLSGGTRGEKLTPYKTVYADEGGAVVDYLVYRIFLPESTMTSIRVCAEDERYYTDYNLYSSGPARNQTFDITMKADGAYDIEGIMFKLAIKTRVKVGAGFKYTRTSYLPFLPVISGDAFYAAPLTGADYVNAYTVTRNMASTYELVLETEDKRYKLAVESVTTDGGIDLVWTPGSGIFTISGENPAVTRIVVRIVRDENYRPPWGYETEARP